MPTVKKMSQSLETEYAMVGWVTKAQPSVPGKSTVKEVGSD
jgi:hypothetical protein